MGVSGPASPRPFFGLLWKQRPSAHSLNDCTVSPLGTGLLPPLLAGWRRIMTLEDCRLVASPEDSAACLRPFEGFEGLVIRGRENKHPLTCRLLSGR